MLHLHRSERADRLVEGLAEVLGSRPPDPFAVEVVAVPAKGVERWITQRLSHVLGVRDGDSDGVCASVRFPSPAALVAGAVSAASGMQPEDDPWERGRVVWSLLDVIDECVAEPWCSTLAGHLGVGAAGHVHRRGRRFTAAQHLARLFDSYGAHRPQMLRDWATGDDTDGVGASLASDLAWQAELWRRLRSRLGTESPAERLEQVCGALQEHPELVDLPERISVFGPTRLTTDQLQVLAALAHRREVHLWLPHPSAALWDRVKPYAEAGAIRRRAEPTAALAANPLLASLARDARELQLRLGSFETTDQHHMVESRPDTLLGRLQQALADDHQPDERPLLQPHDRSLQVHACHGPVRQIEVLREVVVGLLAADPTLEPRDVLVMCPDIEDYAPLISATFGLEDDDGRAHHPGHRLRVRLADRSLRQTNPLLATIAALLELADARVTASQVLDLATSTPVRTRFGFSDDDLERLQQWVATSGVRWGLDAAHRGRFELQKIAQNTWQAGLDRILLGAAMAEEDHRWVGLALPLDDVDSSDIDLAGRLAELVERLHRVLDGMTGERPLTDWLATLTDALSLLTDVRRDDAWQQAQARRELAQVGTDAGDRAQTVQLSLAEVRALLADRLQGRPTRANFRTGNLTMCSMVPMRSVPHRVICLLGLDDGRFPRTTSIDGDDVLARDPCIGERDPRSEDRQLLLDAMLAVGEHLVVLYTGADPRTNAHRPPAVPVGEILDAVDATVTTRDGRPAREQVLVQHPLQPFDPRNFTDGVLGPDGPFSFDRHALTGAERAAQPRVMPPVFLPAPLSAAGPKDISLDDLVWFLDHPARGFLRRRLGVSPLREEEELADGLSVELDNLALWAVGDRLLRSRLSGASAPTCRQAEWRRGAIPPGALGVRVLDTLMAQVEPVVSASAPVRTGDPEGVDVSVDLDGGRRLTGTVGQVHGTAVVQVSYSKLGAKPRLRAWAQLVALSAARPEREWTAVTIGRGARTPLTRSVLGPIPLPRARTLLGGLVDLYDRGMREPLPMATKSSATYAEKRRNDVGTANAMRFAAQDWQGGTFPGECADAAHALVWGEAAPFDVLTGSPPLSDERGEGWPDDEHTRFGTLSRRLWDPLLAAEEVQSS